MKWPNVQSKSQYTTKMATCEKITKAIEGETTEKNLCWVKSERSKGFFNKLFNATRGRKR